MNCVLTHLLIQYTQIHCPTQLNTQLLNYIKYPTQSNSQSLKRTGYPTQYTQWVLNAFE